MLRIVGFLVAFLSALQVSELWRFHLDRDSDHWKWQDRRLWHPYPYPSAQSRALSEAKAKRGEIPLGSIIHNNNNNNNININININSNNNNNINIHNNISIHYHHHHHPLHKWESIVSKHPLVEDRSVLDVPLRDYQSAMSPVADLLKVYVYDDLETVLPRSYASDVWDWLRTERCDSNWITDLMLVNLFRTFPGRVYDPSEADIFVVPYPHLGHCLKTEGHSIRCKQLNSTEVRTTVLGALSHYPNETQVQFDKTKAQSKSLRDRHLFLASDFEMLAQPWLMQQRLLVTHGPIWEHSSSKRRPKRYRSPRGHLVVPPANAALKLQPAYIEQRQREQQPIQLQMQLQLQQKQQQQQQQKQQQNQQNQQNQQLSKLRSALGGSDIKEERSLEGRDNSQTMATPLEPQRDLSLVFVASDTNPNMKGSPRVLRGFLLRALERWKSSAHPHSTFAHPAATVSQNNSSSSSSSITTTTIGGLPFVASSDVRKFEPRDLYDLYRRSVFCPVLPGDIAWQRRFFDAMACGCLPVVISYPLFHRTFQKHRKLHESQYQYKYQENNTTTPMTKNTPPPPPVSWFVPEKGTYSVGDTWSVQESHPFVDQIPYPEFVVECRGNATHPEEAADAAIAVLESLLAANTNTNTNTNTNANGNENTHSLARRQEALERSAKAVVYGVGPDAHRTDDAFAYLIRALRSYVDGL